MQGESALLGSTSPGWQTVGNRRRRRQGSGSAAQAAAATASEGEEHSDGSNDMEMDMRTESPGTSMERILSTSLPSPRQQLGFMPQLAADGDVGVRGDAAAAAPLSPPRSNLHNVLQQREPQPEQQSLGGLARQDSQSAVNLADLARSGGLRSSKSDAAALSAHSTRSAARLRHSAQDGDPASPLEAVADSLPPERVVESAGTHVAAQPRRGGCFLHMWLRCHPRPGSLAFHAARLLFAQPAACLPS